MATDSRYSANILASRPHSVDMLFKIIDLQSPLLVGMSVDTQPTRRQICYDRQSLVYQLTDSGVSVDMLVVSEYC